MDDTATHAGRPAGPLRWLAWMAYSASWTASLLTSAPARVGARVLSSGSLFYCAKSLHFLAYAGWAALSTWLPLPPRRRWPILVILSVHAFGSEYLQQFVPGRYPSWRDVGLDHLGLLLGVAVGWRWWTAIRARRLQTATTWRKAG